MSNIQFACLESNFETETEFFGRYILQPLEIGQGRTIGNSLRRVLLTEIPGIAVLGVRIDGVNNEFSIIPGIREDVLEIAANIKEIIFQGNEFQGETYARLKVQGPSIVTANSIVLPPQISIVNPNQYIATISNNSFLEFELKIKSGAGYLLSENQLVKSGSPKDYIKIDAIFRPIKKVTCTILEVLTQTLDIQEQLILDIWTNGSIKPSDAITIASAKLMNWFTIIKTGDKISVINDKNTLEKQKEKLEFNERTKIEQKEILKNIPIEELNFSVRSFNSLKKANINFLGDIILLSLKDLKNTKNLGQKSITEIRSTLQSRFNITLKVS